MRKVALYIILTGFIFGTMEVALKIGGASLNPLQMTFLRFLIGGLVLLPFAAAETKRTGYRLNGADLRWLFRLGTVGIPVSMLAFQLGVMRCNASTAAVLICLNPMFTMLIAHVFTDDKMSRTKWAALAVSMVGAALLLRPWDVQEGNTVAGLALMLFAAITFAVYSVMGKRSIARIGTFMQTSVSFILGSLLLLVIMLVTGQPVVAGISGNLGIIAYCGVIVTGIGYMFYFLAIRHSNASTGAIAFFIKPVIAPVLAVLILHEQIYWNTVVGIILLVSASFLTLRGAGSAAEK